MKKYIFLTALTTTLFASQSSFSMDTQEFTKKDTENKTISIKSHPFVYVQYKMILSSKKENVDYKKIYQEKKEFFKKNILNGIDEIEKDSYMDNQLALVMGIVQNGDVEMANLFDKLIKLTTDKLKKNVSKFKDNPEKLTNEEVDVLEKKIKDLLQ